MTLTLRARRRRGALEVTLPLYQFEAMRTSFLGRLSEAQAAIRRQAQHVALDLFRAAVAANGASCGAVDDSCALQQPVRGESETQKSVERFSLSDNTHDEA